MSSINPPPVPAPGDSEPGPAPTVPPSLPSDTALWDEADMRVMRGPAAAFADPSTRSVDQPAATIGHIGRYALKHRLGEGGIGTVFAAHDPLLSRLIAVKTLHVEVEESERVSFNALFLNEARAAAGLSHPNIVTVFDAGISDDRAYIAMELLKGRDLRQLRGEGWRATPPQAALIARRVADALGYAHSKGVVHRDVKPANIFMVGRTQPRVLDFGIARVAHRHDGHSLAHDLAAGSPYYMAPEQARNGQVDRRADVFSLGVVLYELLTDVKPFRGATLDEITAAVLGHEPPAANLVDPSVPEALAVITAKALAKNPEHRYHSARAFARELRRWLEDNTTASEGDIPPEASRSRKLAWVALGTLGALVVVGVVWTNLAARRASMPIANQVSLPTATTSDASSVAAVPANVALASAPLIGGVVSAPLVAAALPVPAAPIASSSTAGSVQTPTPTPILNSRSTPAANLASTPASSSAVPSPPNRTDVAPTILTSNASIVATTKVAASPVESPASGQKSLPGTAKTPRESTRDKRARESRERDAARLAASALVAAAPVATGLVHVAISPWGDLEVDGKPAGTSPPLTELTLPQGQHVIVIRNTDLPPLTTSINVTADQPVNLKHKF